MISTPIKPKDKPHYVNNKQFSLAIVEYVTSVNAAKTSCIEIPVVPNYIALCFLKIAEGLSHKSNFIRYTYREEMVMDAVENCLKAIYNYDIDTITRTGMPNAFAYFTQICYYAFLRRIEKEKKQQDIKLRWIDRAGYEEFVEENDDSSDHEHSFFDDLRNRIDRVRQTDRELKDFAKREKRAKVEIEEEDEDFGIEEFMGNSFQ
jgi:hypothetical protein